MNKIRILILFLGLAIVLTTAAEDSRFIVVNLQASEFDEATFSTLAALDDGAPPIRIGVAAIFSYFNEPPDILPTERYP